MIPGLQLGGPQGIIGRTIAIHRGSGQQGEGIGPIIAYGVVGIGHPRRQLGAFKK
jgi:hypothetical protein